MKKILLTVSTLIMCGTGLVEAKILSSSGRTNEDTTSASARAVVRYPDVSMAEFKRLVAGENIFPGFKFTLVKPVKSSDMRSLADPRAGVLYGSAPHDNGPKSYYVSLKFAHVPGGYKSRDLAEFTLEPIASAKTDNGGVAGASAAGVTSDISWDKFAKQMEQAFDKGDIQTLERLKASGQAGSSNLDDLGGKFLKYGASFRGWPQLIADARQNAANAAERGAVASDIVSYPEVSITQYKQLVKGKDVFPGFKFTLTKPIKTYYEMLLNDPRTGVTEGSIPPNNGPKSYYLSLDFVDNTDPIKREGSISLAEFTLEPIADFEY